jgi:exopolyphosphatase/guanosine-5'-triphosphate,3'-diphosphate pyrophosphatase
MVDEYARRIDELGVEQVRMIATSATRDVANRTEFIAGVDSRLGVAAEVVSGAEEAMLSFTGATLGLPAHVAAPYLVVDLGGGSTEFVLGDATGTVAGARSVDVGSVRLTERHFSSDPPSGSQVAAAEVTIRAAMELAADTVTFASAASVIGLAGTVTTIGAMYADLEVYDPAVVHHLRVPASAVGEICGRLLGMTRAQRAAIPVMQPGRADVIAAGALVLRCVVERTGVDEVIVSEHDILDGIAWSITRPE